jgi:hypothetical protein
MDQNSKFVDSFKISKEIKSKIVNSRSKNKILHSLILTTLQEIQKIQENIFKSKEEYNTAFAEYSARMYKISHPKEDKQSTLLPDPSPVLPLEEKTTTLNPSDLIGEKSTVTANEKSEHTIILPVLTEAVETPIFPLIRPIRPSINTNPFHPNNFDCKSKKRKINELINEFPANGLFPQKGLIECADFLNDYFLLNNFIYDSSEESLKDIFKAVKNLSAKFHQTLLILDGGPFFGLIYNLLKDIFKSDKCDQILRVSKKKLNTIGTKIIKISEKSNSVNWETSIESVKEILSESDYISRIKVSHFSDKLKNCLQVRSICKILRKIHNKRALEIKILEDTKKKLLNLVESGSMEVEFNSDNSLNQMKREKLIALLGNTRIAHLLCNVLENMDKKRLSGETPSGEHLGDITQLETKRKEEKLQKLKDISLTDLESEDFQTKIANAVAGEFKTRKLPFINFKLLGDNLEAEMVKKVVKAYFKRKSLALENKAQSKVNLFLYLDYKKETSKYFNQVKIKGLDFQLKPIPAIEKMFSMAMTLKKDKTLEYFLFNTFSRVSNIISADSRKSLIGKRNSFMDNHDILEVMFSDDYQSFDFREKEWIQSLEYVFQKITDLDLSEIMYSEPSRQGGQSKRKGSSSSKVSEIPAIETEKINQFKSQTVEGVLVLPDSKHCTAPLCASNKPNSIIKRISEKIDKLNEILENLNMMSFLYRLETKDSGLQHTVREADLKKIKDFVHIYNFSENNHVLQFSKERTDKLLKAHNNLRYLMNTINMNSVNIDGSQVKTTKGTSNKILTMSQFMKRVDSGGMGWINLWNLEAGKKDYDKCLKKFVRVKTFKHLFPEKINLIKKHLRNHKDLRKDVKDFTLTLKLETQRSNILYQSIREKYWQFRTRFIKTPFYSEELHAVMSQFELVFLLFSLYNEPVSLRNLIGFENLLRETGYEKLKVSACGMHMDQEIDKLTTQLKKIDRCLSIAKTGVFFGSQINDFDKLDFQSCGIVLKDSLDIESYLNLNRNLQTEEDNVKMNELSTCRLVYLVNSISQISVLVKNALCLRESDTKKHHIEQYSSLLFTIFKKLDLGSQMLFKKLFGREHKGIS